jgi:hypothetical protein
MATGSSVRGSFPLVIGFLGSPVVGRLAPLLRRLVGLGVAALTPEKSSEFEARRRALG